MQIYYFVFKCYNFTSIDSGNLELFYEIILKLHTKNHFNIKVYR